ncbi:hypothetical protein D3C76_1324560 [compost metagenome]
MASVVVSIMQRCDVCGRVKHKSATQPWNGKTVCKECIEELTADYLKGGEEDDGH